jgi:aarF domain-containing kinase
MQPITRAFTRTSLAPWTCRRCTLQSQAKRSIRGYSTGGGGHAVQKEGKPRRKGRVVLAAATGTLVLSGLAFQDEVKHAYKAVERTGRVAGTLALCINE